ncbi:tetratricopeptide repeat protein [Gilliamella sp. ESL0250]|uniref:tetratricopeptide repeat protein n=1 Tax=Gilliamella sp. ESL0250 TaxID=2705036 RepID=UPI00406CB846
MIRFGHSLLLWCRCQKNYIKARKWFEKATIQGLAQAQFYLGYMYRYGDGMVKDHQKAEEWIVKAYQSEEIIGE